MQELRDKDGKKSKGGVYSNKKRTEGSGLSGNNNNKGPQSPKEVGTIGAGVAKKGIEEIEKNKKIQWTPHIHKHVPEKNMTWKDVVKLTKNGGPAKYKHDIDNIEQLERMVWGKDIRCKNGSYRVIKFDRVIGAFDGVETNYMVVKNSANTIHGHPISLAEYLKYLK